MGRLHSAVDWLYGFIFNDASLTGGKDTYIQGVSLVTSTTGVALGTAGNPLITAGTGGTSGLTQAEFIAALKSGTGTKSAVASGIASVTILASNANRKGATITNTDANALYLDLSGGTASSTSFSVSIAANGYYEVPFGYTALITGIWAADGAGSALVTEFV